MFKPATLADHQTPPNDPVHCANCGTPMTAIGANYVCSKNAKRGPDRCPTTPVNAESLVTQVVTQLLKRVINDSTIEMLTGDIQETASEASSRQQEQLQSSESSIEELDLLKGEVLQTVEQKLATYPEVAEEINHINAIKMGLAYESQVAQEELDKLTFISNTEGLREDARDIITHFQDAEPEEIRALLNIFIREIRVGPELAEILYSHPLPDEQNHPRIASDRIALVL